MTVLIVIFVLKVFNYNKIKIGTRYAIETSGIISFGKVPRHELKYWSPHYVLYSMRTNYSNPCC